MIFAHFTIHELPGTLGLCLLAFSLGAIVALGGLRPLRAVLPLAVADVACLVVAVLSDQPAMRIGRSVSLAADVGMLAVSGVLAALALVRHTGGRAPAGERN